jgi:parvulin-like peptidyl-prolyl isomerase
MLKIMRHHAKYFYVLFFIVILSFLFWGVGKVDQTSSGGIVAEVGKEKITQEEYYRTYDNAFRFYKDLYKEKFDEEMQKKLKLKESVMNSLIDSRVLLTAAAKNGVTVSDEELSDAVKSEAAFMKNGVFDVEVYKNRLNLSRLTPEAYESAKRDDLIIEKMRRLIELSVNLPEADLSKISADEQTLKSIKDSMMAGAKDKAVKAYIEGLKKDMKIKIYNDRLS